MGVFHVTVMMDLEKHTVLSVKKSDEDTVKSSDGNENSLAIKVVAPRVTDHSDEHKKSIGSVENTCS